MPVAAFHGDVSRHPRTPSCQRDESPWNPGPPPAGRERRDNHSASTRDRPAGSRSGSVRWLPWVAITAPPLTCPVALRSIRPTLLGACKIFRATEYLARPKPGCANRSKVAPAEPCNRLTGCCTDLRYESQSRPLSSSTPSRASSHAARMARSIPLAVNLIIRPVERLTA